VEAAEAVAGQRTVAAGLYGGWALGGGEGTCEFTIIGVFISPIIVGTRKPGWVDLDQLLSAWPRKYAY